MRGALGAFECVGGRLCNAAAQLRGLQARAKLAGREARKTFVWMKPREDREAGHAEELADTQIRRQNDDGNRASMYQELGRRSPARSKV